MQNYEGFKKGGNFTLTNGMAVQGELSLKGENTTLDLYSGTLFDKDMISDILGLFYDRSKVSLIKCITKSTTSGARGGERYYSANVFPHFVIFGEQYITSSDRMIRELSFTVDDAAILFYDFDAFGSVINSKPHMERIVEAKENGRDVEIGEYPQLFYFTGKHEIFVADTVLGKISASHGISYKSPGPEGIHINNTIKLNIVFNSAKTVEEAATSVIDILMFLEVIAGRPQNLSELAFLPVSDEEYPKGLDVYWCMPPHRNNDDQSRKPHPADLPIQAAMNSDEFINVLKSWLERHDEWRNARSRFSMGFAYQNFYDIDRIVGAANMFDILPSSAYSETTAIPPYLVQARDNAREAFQALPVSPERDSVLSVLGRLGKATLKKKARSRAKLITDRIGNLFPELDMVVDQAIDCRNYYVHGSVAKIDYSKHFDQVQFFTDTLEFVFAASDLLQSGWEITAWARKHSSLSHPFAQYRINYALQLSELKKLLGLYRADTVPIDKNA